VEVLWMPAALEDLRAAYAYYAERNPAAADRVVGSLLNAANGLALFPLLGKQGVVPGTRERVVTRYPYRIVYQVVDDRVEVLRVLHAGQLWP
jgi:addiction module RelE/StbE family toxin